MLGSIPEASAGGKWLDLISRSDMEVLRNWTADEGGSMKDLLLDGARWKNSDDVYDSFFRAVGAPSWHGRNFNALRDSIATGQINRIELPYCVVIQNYDLIGAGSRGMATDFVDLLRELRAEGREVDVRRENSNPASKSRG
jgi:RNAse (barnase) inhibitor barstar